MKIRSVKTDYCSRSKSFHHGDRCPECRPGRWYDEQTARLMERAVRIVLHPWIGAQIRMRDMLKVQMAWNKMEGKK